ncbi:MAG: hypothetical protein Q7R58_02570 [bacterium]|nr:hypothetical protein [bacterium]
MKGRHNLSPKIEEILSVVATTHLDAIVGKQTSQCFVGWQWGGRDDSFDNWLPANQPEVGSCIISALVHLGKWTLEESVRTILNVDETADIALLGTLLIERDYTMVLPQAEEMVKKTDSSEKTGVRFSGHGTFFFVQKKKGHVGRNPVLVGSVYRYQARNSVWVPRSRSLDDPHFWDAERRILVPNFAAR